MTPAVRTLGLTKTYPGVVALRDVSVEVHAGSCHALVGENGAGKSTLGKVLCGLVEPDEGRIELFGQPVRFRGSVDAARKGVAIVHQELLFAENMSVGENLCLDDPPRRGPFVDRAAIRTRTRGWLQEVGVDLDPDAQVGSLPIGLRQMAQVAGAIGKGAKVLIFDEPTSSLSSKETEALLTKIRELRDQGVTCVYVSHRMDEIFAICDVATVLRDGQAVGTASLDELDRTAIVRMMIGRDLPAAEHRTPKRGKPVLEVASLSQGKAVRDVSLQVGEGEVVGLAGLVGAGRTELLETIFGVRSPEAGQIRLRGRSIRPRHPAEARDLGIGLVPEDRKRLGLALDMKIRENATMATLHRLAKHGWVDRSRERSVAEQLRSKLRIKASDAEAITLGLSGGNQQKVVLAKWLAADADLLLLDEPTRGVDVGAKSEIHALIRQLADQGHGVLMVSSEMPELLAVADRILVMREGRIVAEHPAAQASESSLIQAMTGAMEETVGSS